MPDDVEQVRPDLCVFHAGKVVNNRTIRGSVTYTDASKQEVWQSYSETVLVFDGEPETVIDLREPVTPEKRRELGLGQPFAVLTSFNPRGENIAAEENARRFAQLEADLQLLGLEYVTLDGCSPDRQHCERSVAVKVDRSVALGFARRWEQLAIFWWDLERFWIYPALVVMEPLPLPRP